MRRSAHAGRFGSEITRLFYSWRNGLLRYLLASGLSVEDGEEIVQEVFLALFQHFVDEKPRSNLRGWAFRVAHNLGLKRRMTVSRRMEVSIHADMETHVDSALNPEEQAAAAQRQTRLESIVRALPEQDRCCLALRAEGLLRVSGNRRNSRDVAGIGIGLLSSFSGPPRSRRHRLTVCGMVRIYRTKSFCWFRTENYPGEET